MRKVLAAPAEPPRYRAAGSRPPPVMGPYLPVIEAWLEDDEKAPRKQRHTAKRVYDRLVDEYDFPGSEVTVRRAVRELRGRAWPRSSSPWRPSRARWPRPTSARRSVMIAGAAHEVFLFCLRAKHSRCPLSCAYPTEKLEAFLAGHVAAFEFFGGIFSGDLV